MSKKLGGNGRWESSRMMLPEHREALIERKLPKPEPQPPNKEELLLIRDSVLLLAILNFAKNGRKSAEKLEHIMKDLFLLSIDALIDRVHNDLFHIHKSMRAANIKVWEDEQIESTMWYRYLCRGYKDRLPISRDLVRVEMSVRLGRYFSTVFKPIMEKNCEAAAHN